LFEHGQFGSTSTDIVAKALMAFSLGLVGNGFSLLLTRAFFSLQEPGVPTRVALVNLALNFVLDIALLRYGAAGIALATAIVTTFNAIALAVLLRRRAGGLGGAELAQHLALTSVATVFCAVTAFGIWYPLDELLGRSLPAQLVSLGSSLAAATAVYMAAATYLRLPEMSLIAGILQRRKEGE
jgi:putative peptidoglycan lipid II flippase